MFNNNEAHTATNENQPISATTHKRAKKPFAINGKDIITLTARLAQLLAEEVDLLKDMKVKKIEALQDEKLFLTEALEAHKKILKRQPELSDSIPSRDKKDLAAVVDVFEDILVENHRRLQMAKEVNQQVVGAIREVVTDTARSKYYDNGGISQIAPYESLSVTLNETI